MLSTVSGVEDGNRTVSKGSNLCVSRPENETADKKNIDETLNKTDEQHNNMENRKMKPFHNFNKNNKKLDLEEDEFDDVDSFGTEVNIDGTDKLPDDDGYYPDEGYYDDMYDNTGESEEELTDDYDEDVLEEEKELDTPSNSDNENVISENEEYAPWNDDPSDNLFYLDNMPVEEITNPFEKKEKAENEVLDGKVNDYEEQSFEIRDIKVVSDNKYDDGGSGTVKERNNIDEYGGVALKSRDDDSDKDNIETNNIHVNKNVTDSSETGRADDVGVIGRKTGNISEVNNSENMETANNITYGEGGNNKPEVNQAIKTTTSHDDSYIRSVIEKFFDMYNERLRKLEDENQSLRTELEETKKNVNESRQQEEKRMLAGDTDKDKLKSLEDESLSLEIELEEIKKSINESKEKEEERKTQIDAGNDKLRSLEEDNISLRTELEEIKKNINDSKQQEEERKTIVDAGNDKLKSLEEENLSLEIELEEIKKSINESKEREEERKTQIDAENDKLRSLEEDNLSLRAELEEIKKNLNVSKLQEENRTIAVDMDYGRLKNIEDDNLLLRSEIEEIKKNISESRQAEEKDIKDDNLSLRAELDEIKKNLSEIRQKEENRIFAMDMFDDKFSKLEDINTSLREKLEETRKDLSESRQQEEKETISKEVFNDKFSKLESNDMSIRAELDVLKKYIIENGYKEEEIVTIDINNYEDSRVADYTNSSVEEENNIENLGNGETTIDNDEFLLGDKSDNGTTNSEQQDKILDDLFKKEIVGEFGRFRRMMGEVYRLILSIDPKYKITYDVSIKDYMLFLANKASENNDYRNYLCVFNRGIYVPLNESRKEKYIPYCYKLCEYASKESTKNYIDEFMEITIKILALLRPSDYYGESKIKKELEYLKEDPQLK